METAGIICKLDSIKPTGQVHQDTRHSGVTRTPMQYCTDHFVHPPLHRLPQTTVTAGRDSSSVRVISDDAGGNTTRIVQHQWFQAMMTYSGTLTQEHLQATIRSALRSQGFESPPGLLDARAHQSEIGTYIRDKVWPQILPSFADEKEYRVLATSDPRLWERLSFMAGLGWRQAQTLSQISGTAPEHLEAVALLGATFNAAISVLDYLADEQNHGTTLFTLLDRRTVNHIFELNKSFVTLVGQAYRYVTTPAQKLLFTLVASCGAQGQALLRSATNVVAWRSLADIVGQLFEAERSVVLGMRTPDRDALLSVLETKSALPSVATLYIALLGTPGAALPSSTTLSSAHTLGSVFWMVDDLVDIIVDARCDVPNRFVLLIEDRVRAEGRETVTDADIYDAIHEGAVQLADKLNALANLEGDRNRAIADFARITVADWVSWPIQAEIKSTVPGTFCRQERVEHAVQHALCLLLTEQRAGYREATHNLRFPRASKAYETHPAVLAQRAVVLDALVDAQSVGLEVPESTVHAEVLSILRAKHRHVRGGWNYIPEIPELPPDIDDVGQVLQALVRVGGSDLASTCDEAIRLALDSANPDGSIVTWIIDPRGSSVADSLVRSYLGVMGGWGVHPEVMANFLYGLFIYDYPRFFVPIHQGIAYLETLQSHDGTWASKWYDGPYYGTYKVAALLAAAKKDSQALPKLVTGIREKQNDDGGWGEANSNALSTALALLTLSVGGIHQEDPSVQRGLELLLNTRETDGWWAAQPWIAFPTLDGFESHGSRTISTAFSLRALLAWDIEVARLSIPSSPPVEWDKPKPSPVIMGLELGQILDQLSGNEDLLIERCRSNLVNYVRHRSNGAMLGEYIGAGKMVRARLALLAAAAVGGNQELALPAAEAVEMLHTASLFHDDIIDEANERRGRPALHVQAGASVALVLGDYLLLHAFNILVRAAAVQPETKVLSAVSILSREAEVCCEGQIEELRASADDVSEEIYFSIARRKTAASFVAAVSLGGLFGGGDEVQIKALRCYAQDIGICFQICDDVLDIRGDRLFIGKPVGSSLSHGRPMLPIIYLLKHGSASGRRACLQLRHDQHRRPELSKLLEDEGIFDYVRTVQEQYIASALSSLQRLPSSPALNSFEAICHELMAWWRWLPATDLSTSRVQTGVAKT